MARINNGLLGGVSGKIGNVVGVTRNGVSFLRTVPSNYKDAKSPAQLANRMKLKICVNFLSATKSFIRIGFKDFSPKGNAYNAAFTYNSKAVQGTYPDLYLDYSQTALSRGQLTELSQVSLSEVEGGIRVDWQNNSGDGSAKGNDTVMLLVYAPESNEVIFISNAGTRADGSRTIAVPLNFANKTVHCWIAMINPEKQSNGSRTRDGISNSTYIGELTLS